MPQTQVRPPQSPVSAERREADPMVELWRATDKVVDDRKRGARLLLARRGVEEPSKDEVEATATAMQRHLLDRAETDEWSTSYLTTQRVALLKLEAAHVLKMNGLQEEDPAPRGSELRARRIGALINFNHDIAAALGCMSPRIINRFPNELTNHMQAIGNTVGATKPKDYLRLIFNGVKGEVAFDRALQAEMPEEWHFQHASAKEDMQGVDGIVVNESGEQLNLDFKRARAFEREIEKRLAKGRITQPEADRAVETRFLETENEVGDKIIPLCIVDSDSLGNIQGFEYEDPAPIVEFVQQRFESRRTKKLQNLGKHAINT